MTSRNQRRTLAEETLKILDQGFYTSQKGVKVEIKEALEKAVQNTHLYSPESFPEVFLKRDGLLSSLSSADPLQFEVMGCTTLKAAHELVENQGISKVLALNFASAKNPGGGFLWGSRAQEESLARSSGLYPCIGPMEEMYNHNRKLSTCLYSDYMIYSPAVPVFRKDEGDLLERPYPLSIITSPAVNAGVVQRRGGEDVGKIKFTMVERMEKILSVALVQGYQTLILGAWGCGVFENDPKEVARWFGSFLLPGGLFEKAFEKVIFAVLDSGKSQKIITPFLELFGK